MPIARSRYSIQLCHKRGRLKFVFPIDRIHEPKFEIVLSQNYKLWPLSSIASKILTFLILNVQPSCHFRLSIFSDFIMSLFHTSTRQGTFRSHSMYGLSASQFVQRLELRSLTGRNLGISVSAFRVQTACIMDSWCSWYPVF